MVKNSFLELQLKTRTHIILSILLILSKHLPAIPKLAEIHARRMRVREPMGLLVSGRMSGPEET